MTRPRYLDDPDIPRHHRRRRRRFFRSGELHLVLLALLAERPQHGYDLMSELELRFGGEYTPSPGSIYPALNALETEGLLTSHPEGDRNVFSVTDSGRRALVDRTHMLAAVETRTGARLQSDGIAPVLDRFVARVRGAATRVDSEALVGVIEDADRRVRELETEEER